MERTCDTLNSSSQWTLELWWDVPQTHSDLQWSGLVRKFIQVLKAGTTTAEKIRNILELYYTGYKGVCRFQLNINKSLKQMIKPVNKPHCQILTSVQFELSFEHKHHLFFRIFTFNFRQLWLTGLSLLNTWREAIQHCNTHLSHTYTFLRHTVASSGQVLQENARSSERLDDKTCK